MVSALATQLYCEAPLTVYESVGVAVFQQDFIKKQKQKTKIKNSSH